MMAMLVPLLLHLFKLNQLLVKRIWASRGKDQSGFSLFSRNG